MAKWARGDLGNRIVIKIRGNQTVNLCICSDQPTTIEEAESTYALAITEFNFDDFEYTVGRYAGNTTRAIY